jgi:hypothetical protein
VCIYGIPSCEALPRDTYIGENQAEIIIEIIYKYNLEPYISYFVTNNAINNDTAIKAVLKYFFPKWLDKKRTTWRLRCLGHVINLAAKAFLYGYKIDAFEKNIESFRE